MMRIPNNFCIKCNECGNVTLVIERIEIHNNEKKHSHNNVKVDIYFTAIGLFDIPTEQELLKAVEEIKYRKQLTDKSA